MGTWIEFQSEGRPVRGYLAKPKRKTGPGILVMHAWWGLNPTFQDICDRLAAQGYTAFAPDLYGGQVAETVDGARQLLEAMEFLEARAIAANAVQVLKGHASPSPLGAIGFSMGAAWAIFLSCLQPDDFRAIAVFYGSESAEYPRSQSAYLGHFAEEDEWEPLDGVRQMETNMCDAGCEVEFHYYPGTHHWFFEPDRPEYNPEAAERAWERTLAFFAARLNPQAPLDKDTYDISSDSVSKRTGKSWEEWFSLLDQAGAAQMSHPEIARFLESTCGLSGWWSQHVTGHYEQARGRRLRHEMPGGFQISRSRVISAPLETLFHAWADDSSRLHWLGDIPVQVRKATPGKSIRLKWDISPIEVRFTAKGSDKTQVSILHSRLADAPAAEQMKTFWAEALNRLESYTGG